MNAKHKAKVVWFQLLTGCDAVEAEKWLKLAKWRMDVARQLRRADR